MTTRGVIYLDSSAIVKLVVPETETAPLYNFLDAWPQRVSSMIARVEVIRALRRALVADADISRGDAVLDRIALARITEPLLRSACEIEPTGLRALDALHLATAESIRDELGGFVTYDERQAEAARALGLPAVTAPA